jgi:hypothetical protein
MEDRCFSRQSHCFFLVSIKKKKEKAGGVEKATKGLEEVF